MDNGYSKQIFISRGSPAAANYGCADIPITLDKHLTQDKDNKNRDASRFLQAQLM
jgi:hypothetical protein